VALTRKELKAITRDLVLKTWDIADTDDFPSFTTELIPCDSEEQKEYYQTAKTPEKDPALTEVYIQMMKAGEDDENLKRSMDILYPEGEKNEK